MAAPDGFPTTRLSLILAAAGAPGAQSQDALAALCRMYWQPLYAFVRRRGHTADEAQDLTQSFIARLLEKNSLRDFRHERGRFRAFLLGSLKNFLANQRDWARAQKRGGGLPELPLDAARDDLTPDKVFEKQWALGLLQRVLALLREESVRAGKGDQFDRLKGYLTGDGEGVRYRQLAQELGLSEGAVKVAVHRLRQRFHEALREEVSLTVTRPEEIGDEIRHLIQAIRA